MELSNKILDFFTNLVQGQYDHFDHSSQSQKSIFLFFTILSVSTNFDLPSMYPHSFSKIQIIFEYKVGQTLTFRKQKSIF